MAEPKVNLDTNLYFDMNSKNENGEYGVWRKGFRDPDSHMIHFGDPADVTPAAREKAVEQGVDVNTVEGTGKEGRVTAQDVEKAAKS